MYQFQPAWLQALKGKGKEVSLYFYPDSFAGPLPPPQGSAYLLTPQFVGCEPHATLISLRTRTSVFSLPLWRLFVPHIVTDGMFAFTKEQKTRNEMVKFSMFCLGFKVQPFFVQKSREFSSVRTPLIFNHYQFIS